MSIFRKASAVSLPENYTSDDIITESSICTGERTIGFYDKKTGRLAYAELVRSEKDVEKFYRKYGLDYAERH